MFMYTTAGIPIIHWTVNIVKHQCRFQVFVFASILPAFDVVLRIVDWMVVYTG